MNPPPAPPFFLFLGFSTHPPNQILTATAQNLVGRLPVTTAPGLATAAEKGFSVPPSHGMGAPPIKAVQWAPTDWRVRPFTRRGLGNQCRRGRPRSPLGSVHAGGVGLGRSACVRVHGRRRDSVPCLPPGASRTFCDLGDSSQRRDLASP